MTYNQCGLNVLPFGSYDVLIGMDWLEEHWSLVNCKDKTINYLRKEGIRQELQGIRRPMVLRPITASQLGKFIHKGFLIYVVEVGFTNLKHKSASLGNLLVIQEFLDVFPEDIPGLPPK